MGFSRQEYWSGLPFPSPGDLPNPGIKPGSPGLGADALTAELPGKPEILNTYYQILKTYYLGSNYRPIEETFFFISLYNIMYVCTYMYIMYVTYNVCLSFLIVFPPFVSSFL